MNKHAIQTADTVHAHIMLFIKKHISIFNSYKPGGHFVGHRQTA